MQLAFLGARQTSDTSTNRLCSASIFVLQSLRGSSPLTAKTHAWPIRAKVLAKAVKCETSLAEIIIGVMRHFVCCLVVLIQVLIQIPPAVTEIRNHFTPITQTTILLHNKTTTLS